LSVAFVKEESAEAASETVLPARPIPDRPNLVTEAGFKMLEAELERARQMLDAASSLEDISERRRQSAAPFRDVRYFAERLRTAVIRPIPSSNDVVAFGHTVTFERDDGRVQTFRISDGSPVASALLGKSVGDIAHLGPHEIEVLSIS
jgi:transcription elongation GreA/GreB family factor